MRICYSVNLSNIVHDRERFNDVKLLINITINRVQKTSYFKILQYYCLKTKCDALIKATILSKVSNKLPLTKGEQEYEIYGYETLN